MLLDCQYHEPVHDCVVHCLELYPILTVWVHLHPTQVTNVAVLQYFLWVHLHTAGVPVLDCCFVLLLLISTRELCLYLTGVVS